MTALEGGMREQAIRRNVMGNIGTPGLTESLAAPGVVAAPPVSQVANELEQVMRAMGLVGDVAAQVGNVAGRLSAEDAEKKRATEVYLRGMASRAAREDIVKLRDQISTGKLRPRQDQTPEDFARELVGLRGDGQDEAWRDEYESILYPETLSLTLGKIRADTEQQKASLAQNLEDAAISATSAEGMEQAVQRGILDLGLTREEALARVVVPALRSAATAGDTGRFNAARSVLRSSFIDEQNKARDTMTLMMRRRADEAAGAAADSVYGLINKGQLTLALKAARDLEPVIGSQKAGTLEAAILGRDRANTENTLWQLVDQGAITPEDFAARLDVAVNKPSTELGHLPAETVMPMRRFFEKKTETDAKRDAVRRSLAGDRAVLIPAAWGKEVVDVFREQGLVNQNNAVPDWQRLETAVVTMGITAMPTELSQIVAANFASTDPATVVNASRFLATLDSKSPSLRHEMVSQMPEEMQPLASYVMTAIAANPGIDDAGILRARQDAVARQTEWLTNKVDYRNNATDKALAEAIGSKGFDASAQAAVFELLRSTINSNDGFPALFGTDRAWWRDDPDMQSSYVNPQVEGIAFAAFVDAFRTHYANFGDTEMAKQAAQDAMQKTVFAQTAGVSWNGDVTMHVIENIPPAAFAPFQWATSYEEPAKKFLEDYGVDPETVVPVPNTVGPRIGWKFRRMNGFTAEDVYDSQGNLVVFQPNVDASAVRQMQMRRDQVLTDMADRQRRRQAQEQGRLDFPLMLR